MKNATELRNELSDVFMKLKEGSIKPKDATEFANIAGKMINSATAQIKYYALRGKESPQISFLDEPVVD